jgi:hypothetical protein
MNIDPNTYTTIIRLLERAIEAYEERNRIEREKLARTAPKAALTREPIADVKAHVAKKLAKLRRESGR